MEWEPKFWNERVKPSNQDKYTIEKIKEIAAYYNIQTVVEGSTITPLHYLFAKYIADDLMIGKLLARI